jgi:Holliday junction resolvasome RuvABC DNA-binding subunit
MISSISGEVVAKKDGVLIIKNGGVSYEVLMPLAVLKAMEKEGALNGEIELITYHYFQMSQSTGVPVLIGFQNEVEKEFF